MKQQKSAGLFVRVEPAIKELIGQGVQATGLSQSDVVRQGIRLGIPLLLRPRTTGDRRHRLTLDQHLAGLQGLEIRERHHPLTARA
jgi:hypothetical protein